MMCVRYLAFERPREVRFHRSITIYRMSDVRGKISPEKKNKKNHKPRQDVTTRKQ